MSPIKYIGNTEIVAEISDQVDYLVKWKHFDVLNSVLMVLRPEECDGMINFCLFVKCLPHEKNLPNFKLFQKRAEQALKNQNQMAMVAAIQNINIV